jgi:hypothetical protein
MNFEVLMAVLLQIEVLLDSICYFSAFLRIVVFVFRIKQSEKGPRGVDCLTMKIKTLQSPTTLGSYLLNNTASHPRELERSSLFFTDVTIFTTFLVLMID